jgi:hypothetical protein
MQIRTNLIFLFVLVVFAASVGLAQNKVKESFGYAPTSLAGLGDAENGFSGPWVNDETGGVEGLVAIGNTRFDYSVMNWDIPYDTLHLQVVKNGAWSDHNRYKRPLAELWPNEAGKSYWVSYLIDVKTTLPIGNTYFFVKLFEGTTERLAIGKAGGRDANPAVWTCGSGWTGSGDDVSAVEIATGPVWIVARIDMNGATTGQRTYMWVDPDPGVEPDTNTADVKRNSEFSTGFDNLALEFGGDGNDQRLIFDEIVIADNFEALTTTSVRQVNGTVPVKYNLSQNYPNPFNPTTNIRFAVPVAGMVSIKVYNLIGQEVATVMNEYQAAGTYDVDFNAANLPSGIYMYRITTEKYSEVKKMLLLK